MRATLISIAIAVASGTATAVSAAPVAMNRSDEIGRPELVRDVAVQDDDARGATRVSFAALGRHFALELEPVALFAHGARTLWIGDGGTIAEEPQEIYLAGRLSGAANSRVRLSRPAGGLDGVIVTDDEIYYLAPAAPRVAAATGNAIVVHRQSDTPPAAYGRCGVEQTPLGTRLRSPAGAAPAGGVAALARAEISVVADYEFYRLHGANTAAVMQGAINTLNAIYERDLGVTFAIRNTVVYTTAGDPFGATIDPNALLDEFSDFTGDRNSPIAGSDLAHLFTGRDLKGSVVGIAWLGSVCGGAYATGLSQNLSASLLASVVAHEIGHNFGAPHDAARCTSPATGYIMQPNLSCVGRSSFSPQSQNDIAPVVESAACLSSGGVPMATPSPTRTRTPAAPPGTPTATRTRAATRTPTPTGPTRTPTETPVFSPARLTGLVLWLDAARLGALADGAAVASWADGSGAGHDALQATAGGRPTYRGAVLNGRPAVRFDGVDDRLIVTGELPHGPDLTVVLVGRPDVADARAFLDLGDSAAGTGFIITPEYAVRTAGGERRWQPSASLSTPAVTVIRQNGASTTRLATWVNGRRLAVSLTRSARITTAGRGTIGAPTSPGTSGVATFAGDLAEVLVYDQALSTAERTALEQYLGAKYGIAITL